MSKFIITATDRETGQRLYAHRADGCRVAFRSGYALHDSAARLRGLHTDRSEASLFEIEEAGRLLTSVILAIGSEGWIENPCIMLHHA